MQNQDFSTIISAKRTPMEVFNAITNVRGWWSEDVEGSTEKVNDEFSYQYSDVHRCKMKLTEVIPGKRVVWQVLDNHFSFTQDKSEWVGTQIVFDIAEKDNKTQLRFTHVGLVPEYECYTACVNGWSQYIQESLLSLITTGKGQPNAKERAYTVHEVAARFNDLARQERWFEIQDQLFADNIKSIEPPTSPWLKNAEGKSAVRQKAEEWVARIEAVHRSHTTEPVVGGNHFAVGRELDITVKSLGRIQMNEVIIYEVKDARIVTERFIY